MKERSQISSIRQKSMESVIAVIFR